MKQYHGDQIKEDEIDRNVAHLGEMINTYKILVKIHGRMRSPGRPRCKWEHSVL
jgi:hypothetical protein